MGVMATPWLEFGASAASTRLHAGQGPVLRGGFVIGDGFGVGLEDGGRMPWVIVGGIWYLVVERRAEAHHPCRLKPALLLGPRALAGNDL